MRRLARTDPAGIPLALLLLVAATPAGAAAQEQDARALTKSELVRLLVARTYDSADLAAIVSRVCLTFRPNAADLADLRDLGATEEVMAAVQECDRAQEPLRLELDRRQVMATAGDMITVRVRATVYGGPATGSRLVLSDPEAEPSASTVAATTDARGVAVFRVAVGTRSGDRQLTIAAPGRGTVGRPFLSLHVAAAMPAVIDLEPDRLEADPDSGEIPVRVAVTDRFGNPVAGARVDVRGPGGGPAPAAPVVTDGDGAAELAVDQAALPPTGPGDEAALEVLVGGRSLAQLPYVRREAPEAVVGAEPEDEGAAGLEAVAAAEPEPTEIPAEEAGAAAPAPRVAGWVDTTGIAGEPEGGEESGARQAAAGPVLETLVLGGGTFEDGRSAGNGTLEVVVQPAPFLRLRGLIDEGLNAYAPVLVRGGDSFRTLLAGVELLWGEGGRFGTLLEIGRRDQADELYSNLYRLEQSVGFRVAHGTARWRAGAFYGRWYDRDDWLAYTGIEVPVDPAGGLLGEVSSGETVGTNVGDDGRRADRDTRLSFGGWFEPVPTLRLEPVVVLGRVSSDEEDFDGTLVEGRLTASVAIAPAAGFQVFLRHQRPPGGPAFTSLAAGFSFRVDRGR